IGGVLAAPLGAFFAKRIPMKVMLVMVGTVLTITSTYGFIRAVLM
ncbi:MAG: sulfite exporter TauE/SafE family protein, partial [Oxalobacteraceae bacterium]